MSNHNLNLYNELINKKYKLIDELRILENQIQEHEKIIRNTCQHERERDYTVVSERAVYYCRKCNLHL